MITKPLEEWSDEDIVKALKAQGEANLYFFLKEICGFGYNPDKNGPRITEDQKPLCDALQEFLTSEDPKDWLFLIMTPRDTLKSTVLQGAALWETVRNPNCRNLFYGEVHEQAQKRLAVIERTIRQQQAFLDCYGDLDGSKVAGLPWNKDMLTMPNRKETTIREAQFETAGLDVVVNARHFDRIWPDDLHSEKNTKTKDQIEDVKEKFQMLMPLKSKGGKIIVAGVFWNDSDVHTWIREELKPKEFIRGCYGEAGAEEGQIAYPTALPEEEIKIRKKTMRADLYSCHYLMNPVSKSNQSFQKEYFQILPRASFQAIRNVLLIDPAGDPTSENAERRDSDYYGMEVWSMNGTQDLMLTDGFMEKCSPTEAVEYALVLMLRYKPFIIGIERAAVGNLRFYLKEELRKQGLFAIVDDLLPLGRSKLQRALSMEPIARRRKCFIADECPIKDKFFDQITRITPQGIKAKHDDLIDPFGYIPDILKAYGTPVADTDDNAIPADLAELDPVSRDHWIGVRKARENQQSQVWAGEFCH